jgi:hypothetical protein
MPNGRPHEINNMAQTSIPNAGFAPQTAMNGSASVAGASFVGETNQASEVWSSLLATASPQQQKQMLGERCFLLFNIIRSFGRRMNPIKFVHSLLQEFFWFL